MSVVLALAKNKREEYKRQLDAEFQDQQRKDEQKREVDRSKLLHDLLTQQQQIFAAQFLQQQQAYTQPIQQLIAQNQATAQMAAADAPAPVAPIPAPQSTRLPQRQIKHFKGDILQWRSFWESFNASIHSSTMSDVRKFDYLKEYLKGEAYLCVENLELTAANYNIAIAELKRVYAKPKALIQTHLCKFDNLAPVRSMTDVSVLRRLQLTVQSHINALETLGVQKDTFGGLLGKKLIKLVPAELQKDGDKICTHRKQCPNECHGICLQCKHLRRSRGENRNGYGGRSNGKETMAILFIDDGSHRSWVTRSISKSLNLKIVAVENIGTRVFKQRKPNPVEQINAVELAVRGTWKGAHSSK
ncbi:Uncharacterized protein APZ42_029869 [Daphnia magna]|uniref:Uncharacterized protein n=1 Tax=Daphnia magna TaxID=35525 RepID=A0A164P916_9CRUS|nr:Uncharacterized protein APZ42_029869 [Daphnia magna]